MRTGLRSIFWVSGVGVLSTSIRFDFELSCLHVYEDSGNATPPPTPDTPPPTPDELIL